MALFFSAAGDKCGQKNDSVMASTHHCMSCGFHMHSPLFCGEPFDEWLAGIGASFVPTMLPPHGQSKFADYADRLGKTGLFICQRCIDNVSKKISSAPVGSTITCTAKAISASSLSNEDDDDDVEVQVIATSTKQKKKSSAKTPRQPKTKADWTRITRAEIFYRRAAKRRRACEE